MEVEGSFPAGAKAVSFVPLVRAESRAAGASLGLLCSLERKPEGSSAMAQRNIPSPAPGGVHSESCVWVPLLWAAVLRWAMQGCQRF